MLSVYCQASTGLKRIERNPEAPLPEEAVWLDLLEPTVEEERLVEARVELGSAGGHVGAGTDRGRQVEDHVALELGQQRR